MDKLDVARKILEAFPSRGKEELSALLGQDVSLQTKSLDALQAQAFFEQREGKLVLASIQVEGEKPGQAWCVAQLQDALRLGGTLIMLPEEEIQERISSGEFGDEAQDAFGEIINVLTGVLSALFEKIYPDKIRMVKTGVEMVDALEVAAGGQGPIPEGDLVVLEASGELAGNAFAGPLALVFPQELFAGQESEAAAETGESAPSADEAGPQPTGDQGDAGPAGSETETRQDTNTEDAAADKSAKSPGTMTLAALGNILKLAANRVGAEVTGFLGQNFAVKGAKVRVVPHHETLAGLDGQMVLSEMQLESEDKHPGYLLAPLRAAIRLGGTLIMLPDAEMENRLASGEFGEEDSDAFGELVNIIAGVFTSVFKDQCKKDPVRFVKTGLQQLDPLEAAAGSSPIADGEYLLIEAEGEFAGESIGPLRWCFPVQAFPLAEEPVEGEPGAEQSQTAETDTEQPEGAPAAAEGKPVVVLLCNDADLGSAFADAAAQLGFVVRRSTLAAPDGEQLLADPEVKLVLLVMEEVGEKGLAAAIRIHALVQNRIPVIAAGPNWTRSMVLRAIKYGIRDILVTPAAPDCISSKLREYAA